MNPCNSSQRYEASHRIPARWQASDDSGQIKQHTMKPSKFLRPLCAGLAMLSSTAMGAFTFTDGDVILGFQSTSGIGQTKNLFFNLGSATSIRDNPVTGSPVVLGNLSTALTNTFGAGWYADNDIHFGAIANLRGLGLPFAPNQPVAGDPHSTFYVSAPAATIGSGTLYGANSFVPLSLTSTSTNLSGLEGILQAPLVQEAGNTLVLSQLDNPVQWQNGWTEWNPITNDAQGAAFNLFSGGIQQTFGKLTDTTYLDLQRILPTNTGANPTGVVGGGTYETTFAISSNGTIAMVPEPSSFLLVLGAGLAGVFRRRRND